ncbi:MAG: flagellar basal body-associated FliL family protein [Proteobacteria bacterium]|nr:flagellar basal body-associated FliL family protein [Pseudomonadota bacterium]
MLTVRAMLRAAVLCVSMLGVAVPALANDHGGGGGGGGEFVPLEVITTNLASEPGGEGHFIQIAITFRLSDPAAASVITAYMPIIRHKILLLLGSHSGSSLQSTQAREELVEEIKDVANATVGTPAREDKKGRRQPAVGPVKHALFTSFIIQ